MRHRLTLDAPARGFLDSFLLGNGRLGVTIAGGIGTETFDLNADTLWSGGPWRDRADETAPARVRALREAIGRRSWEGADLLATELQSHERSQSYVPVGRMSWTYAPHATAEPADTRGYSRALDLAAATASCRGARDARAFELDTFVSAPDDLVVASSSTAGLTPSFTSPHPLLVHDVHAADGVVWIVAAGRAPADVVPEWVVDAPNPIVYGDDDRDDRGTVAAGMGFAFVAALQQTDTGSRVLATVETGFSGWRARPIADPEPLVAAARARVSAALARSTQELHARHVEDHRSYFDRTELDLDPDGERAGGDPPSAELLFDLGRYLLISSSRPGTQAANLQGIWNVDARPVWSSNYTTNINLQMNYWGAEPLGLSDLHEPLMTFAGELAFAGTDTAAARYGAPGTCAHHNVDLWRFSAPVAGHPAWANWPSALPWIAAHLWQHTAFGDAPDDFAAGTALPVHRRIVEFVLHHLDDDGGGLLCSPSTSPENRFHTGDRRSRSVSAGAALDQELAREVIERYVALLGHARTPLDDDLEPRARSALERLRAPLVVDGVLQEWREGQLPMEVGHRHLSHLYGLYPGDRIARDPMSPEYAAAVRAFRERLAYGSGQTGWSQAWVLCIAARIGDTELAETSLAELAGPLASPSLLGVHHVPDTGSDVFQIDGNLGVLAGVAELLVQSHGDALRLLPTLPPSWPSGRVRGLRVRGGHRVDATWRNHALVEATIAVADAGRLSVELPSMAEYVVAAASGLEPNAESSVDPGSNRSVLSWVADAHTTYVIAPRAR